MHGLPMEFLKVKNAETILNQMGELVEIENMMVDGQLVRYFVRARIRINVSQPLSTGCWVPRRNLPQVWVSIKYEKLQDLCFNCGVIGHEQRGCKGEKEMSSHKREVPRYGAFLSVPPAKDLNLIIKEQGRWKQRNTEGAGHPNMRETTKQNEDAGSNQGALVVRNGVREEGPAPPPNLVRRMGRVGPVNNLPFTNLRVQQGIPGFPGRASFRLDDNCERRFGEHPWRPRVPEEEESEQGKGEASMAVTERRGLDTANTSLGRSETMRREKETNEREERGKAKLEGVSRGGSDRLMIADGEEVEKNLRGDIRERGCTT